MPILMHYFNGFLLEGIMCRNDFVAILQVFDKIVERDAEICHSLLYQLCIQVGALEVQRIDTVCKN